MQGETATSQGGGHHKCSKCNWPYANPHPSAKQRRHHKKVCGKVQGYIIISDEDDKPLNAHSTTTTTADNNIDGTSTHFNGSDEKQQQHQPDQNQSLIQIKVDVGKSNGKCKMDKWLSTKSEEDVFSDAITDFAADPLSRTNSIIQQANDPSNDSHSQSPQAFEKVEDQMENGRKEDLASSSDMPSLVDSGANKFGNVYSEKSQSGENITEVKQVSEMNEDDLVETLPSSIDSSAVEISAEKSEIASKLEKMNGLMVQEISSDIVDAHKVSVTDDEAKEAIMDSKVSQADNGLKGFETLSSAIDSSAGRISGEESEIDSKLEKMHGLMEQEISPDIADARKVLVTDDESKEAMMDSKVSQAETFPSYTEVCITRDVHKGLSVHPENAHVDAEKLSEVTVEDSEDHELLKPELGPVPDCCKVVVDTELHHNNTEEVHLSSSKSDPNADSIVPEEQVHGDNHQQEMVVLEVIVEGRADISVAMDTVDNGIKSLPNTTKDVLTLSQTEKDEIDAALGVQEIHCGQQHQSSNIEPEAHSVVAVGADTIPSPSDAVNLIMPDDAVCEDEAKVDYPNVSVTSHGVAREENFINPTEKSPLVAVCPSESLANLIHEERNLDYNGGSGVIHSCAENSEVKELMVASVNGKVEDNNIGNSAGEPSDVHSQSLSVEEGNRIPIQQSDDSLVVGPPDCSIDTISQTDGLEANWGSISDGTSLSLKDVSDVQGTNTPVSMEAAQGTDSQNISTDRFEPPSITSLVKSRDEGDLKSASTEIQTQTTQGDKKEDSSAKLSLDSGKTHSTSLRSLLGSIIESKKVKTKQNYDGQLPKTVNSTTATESTVKTNQQKEWDSPARFPVTMHREKRKVKQWVPFMCCSSAVNLKTQS
ncbi:hypothetical protein MKX01_007632 [Papaver californicum]|nr:hypothetical protein MKX01_007632 [Papaver californicum]